MARILQNLQRFQKETKKGTQISVPFLPQTTFEIDVSWKTWKRDKVADILMILLLLLMVMMMVIMVVVMMMMMVSQVCSGIYPCCVFLSYLFLIIVMKQ